ncbi:hypothetical protein F5J12DRAFT_921301 [Pisolithus orientalis]|uniref:uncharacterized protein n=1 Tax=Pisolithus orientalis TaxID=936130 RepID=UPI0022252EEF|nr:uncharacterized protein F5J12DRAFT_921301 [Pisolithus orientalis]KAI6005074.1 hypothetical protein F5J12DRAFT_921301 [Pisolithus orientalis]
MNSDDYYFNDELDSGVLQQLDVIEAAHRADAKPPPKPNPQSWCPASAKQPRGLEADDSYVDLSLELDATELQRLDSFVNDAYRGKPAAVAGPTSSSKPSSQRLSLQTTLFGDVLQPTPSTSRAKDVARTSTKPNSRNIAGGPAPKTKMWDHTAFAKSGWKKPKPSKGKGVADPHDSQEEEEIEFEQFPAPFVSGAFPFNGHISPPPLKLKADLLEAKHWIYPLNQPKRDYQFNIVQRCLFDNTLVALPTGLGKTFIAGVVMLNYYRWFPDGKVVFIAPTKPLVAQQITACHQTCGIPGRDAVELTGNNSRTYRSQMWTEKRVFYMTPQTLMNDLVTENCDPRDIILLVIDEAHKGTGDYAYAQVVRFLMAKNPHFRVLALTATPGSSQEAVQAIVDSLHISRIEIRDERSLDLREYMHKKQIKQHIIQMNDEIIHFQQLLKTVMEGILKPLIAQGVIEPLDVVKMHPYRALATQQRISCQRNHPHKWALGVLSKLGMMARAMGYLMEASTEMCMNCLQEYVTEKEKDHDGKKGPKNALKNDPTFQKLLSELESHKGRPGGFGMHPKMETLKLLLMQHFGSRMADGEETSEDTKAMVFVTYRECVDEIVAMLNEERPLLKATKFVGQGLDKKGRKGFAQKEQLEVIRKFKAGEFNVLVSTSIGEEGLDIGEVDMIVCYDAQKTPIRMLQRVGRTGRKRDGYVHVLLAEVREELNWDKAKDTYGEMQRCIVRGDQLELYGDVPRLLPDHTRPQVLEKKMEIEEYSREKPDSVKTKAVPAAKGKKRKRNDDIDRNIPPEATKGFVSVADLLVKKKKKTKARSVSESAAAQQNSKKKTSIRKARSDNPGRKQASASVSKKGKGKGRSTVSQPSLKSEVPGDDMDVEPDISPAIRSSNVSSITPSSRGSPAFRMSSPDIIVTGASPLQPQIPASDEAPIKCRKQLDPIRRCSPQLGPRPASPAVIPSSSSVKPAVGEVIELTSSPSPLSSLPLSPSPSRSILHEQDGKEPSACDGDLPPPDIHQAASWLLDDDDDDDDDLDIGVTGSSLVPKTWHNRSSLVARPPSPGDLKSSSWSSDVDVPEASFAIRPAGKRLQKRYIGAIEDGEPLSPAISPNRRLVRKDTEIASRPPSPPPQPKKRRKPMVSIRHNPWLDGEAEHSGDEVSDGSSHSADDVESESDRQFLKDIPDTQVSPSYDQFQVYRRSLLTQVPQTQSLPVFANKPVKKGAFITAREHSRRQPVLSSSPPRESDEPDEYVFGSFVVADDADLSFE